MRKLLERYFRFIRGFIPTPPPTSSVGLDITPGECKMVELRHNESGIEVLRVAVERLNTQNPVETIKSVLADIDLANAKVQTALHGKGTLIRYIEMPRMTLDELRNSFSLEADKYFPFAQGQIYTDCFILDPEGKTKQMDVMAAASTKDLVDERLKMLTTAGVTADMICINSVALANIIKVLETKGKLSDKADDSICAILEIGETVSSVTIVVNGLPRFSRDVFIGGRDFTKRIGNALGIEAVDAEILRRNPGAREKEVTTACESLFQNLTQELRLSFDYFSTEKSKEVHRVLLTGDNAMMPGIKQALEEHLEVKLEIWNPFEKLGIAAEVKKEDISKKAHALSVALGLALYGNN